MAIQINGNGTITGISAGGLPAGSVTSATLASGLAAQGITMVDQWRVSSSFNSNNTDIDSNWERVDTGGFGQVGTGMTQSSGIFTFPSTGVYRIDFQAAAARGSADSIRYVNSI